MDTMMPGAWTAFRQSEKIRKIPKFSKLPIISLTAKAMKGDREKALEAAPQTMLQSLSILAISCR